MAYFTPDRNEYGGEDYAGSLEGILILVAIVFVYAGLMWLCERICKTEAGVKTFFKVVTHGPNIAFLVFFLAYNPFRSFNSFLAMVGSMIFTTFMFWGIREALTDTTWKSIQIREAKRKNKV